jgi:hypothetical protein
MAAALEGFRPRLFPRARTTPTITTAPTTTEVEEATIIRVETNIIRVREVATVTVMVAVLCVVVTR